MKSLALVPLVVLVAPLQNSQQEAAFAPSEADWAARDLEGRWVLIERETLEHGWARVESLVRFLEERREVELLERLCLYPRSEGHFATFEGALARLDAPQWARAVEWNLRQLDSHKRDEANAAFAERRRGVARAWLEAHESELRPLAAAVLAKLRAAQVEPVPAPHLLPPHDMKAVLEPLFVQGPVELFGSATRAKSGVTYLHQIENALRVIAQKQLFEEPWLSAVLALTRHERAEVRAHAWLTLGEAARGRIPASTLSCTQMLQTIESESAGESVRIAATLALGQRASWDPVAWVELHHLAMRPAHPVWSTAVHALRNCGDGLTAELLAEVLAKLEQPTQRYLATAVIESLRARPLDATELVLERTATAELLGSSLAPRRSPWTQRALPATSAPFDKGQLSMISVNYGAALDVLESLRTRVLGADLDGAVRGWAKRLLDER